MTDLIIIILLIGLLVWREWENQRERRALLDRILGYKVILPVKKEDIPFKAEKADKGMAQV